MAQIEVSDSTAKFVNKIVENIEAEKSFIADALTTVIENIQDEVDEKEYMNVCSVLGRYNRLVSLLANKKYYGSGIIA